MPGIQVLDPHVADLIAAGEVVERPASVVKELAENAIDAGASAVTVEIQHGGMSMIRVADNGCGIPREELATAFLRHATSKLRSQRDLEAIGTLGFRGEALAAIAAVSRVTVFSRPADAPLGATLTLDGGRPGAVEDAGCPPGTTMVVRDLFFNTPARLKFMKKDSAEGAAVFGVVQRLALSHPEVSVKFIRDGKQVLLTSGDGKLESAVYAVLGREFALGMIPVRGSAEEVSVTGYVSLPVCCRGSRNNQYFFVNGRHVKSDMLTAAVENAYANQKMVGRFPSCVIHVTTQLSAVDVNVHPAKTEVKFGSERQVFNAVYYTVRSTLEEDTSRPSLEIREPARAVPAQAPQARGARVDSGPAGQRIPPAAAAGASGRAQTPPRTGTWQNAPGGAASFSLVTGSRTGGTQMGLDLNGAVSRQPKAPEPETGQEPRREKIAGTVRPEAQREEEVPWRVVGEVLHTYIIVEQGDTVIFIDKHAAHERMNFDRMKAEGYRPMAQILLTPVAFTPSAEEQEALLNHLPLLSEFGFELEDFGGGALLVRQVPSDVDEQNIESTLTEIADKLLITGTADPGAARDDVLHTMACKAAIKGGQKNSLPELERVADAVIRGEVRYCPHGRPVSIQLTRAQLEKQFKRT